MSSPRGRGPINRMRWWYWLVYGTLVFWRFEMADDIDRIVAFFQQRTA